MSSIRSICSVLLASVALAGAAAGGAQQPSPAPRGPAPVAAVGTREQTADQQVLQVLNRLAFGPRPGDVAAVRRMGVDAWIARQLHPETIADPVVDRLRTAYPLLAQDQGTLLRSFVQAQRERRQLKREAGAATSPDGAGTAARPSAAPMRIRALFRQRVQLVGELESERVARAVASDRQLLEVMTDFWENHFSVYVRKNGVEPYLLPGYDRVIRAHALGNFRDLLGAVAKSPAMLVYLDNAQSRANPGEPTLAPAGARRAPRRGGPRAPAGLNENYGRELLELHTLGVDGGYTQQDVIAAARALTGWSVTPPALGASFVFRPAWHDAGPKVFLGHTLPAGRGIQDGETVLDIVARSPATAHHIARELCVRFVSDSPSTALVDRAAQTFLRTGGDIRETVRTIVTSPEFFSAAAYRAKVKSPFETVVSAARALGAAPDTTVRTALAVAYLGEPLFGHQQPNGWPETGESWMNTGAILGRINFGLAVAADRLPGAHVESLPGAIGLAAAPRATQVDAAVQALLGGAVSPDTRRILESGDHPFAADAAAQAAQAASAPAGRRGTRNVLGPPPKLSGFAQIVGLALGAPEFQRR